MDVQRLKELRNKSGLTQQDVANTLGFTNQQRYNYYETGKREPDNDTLVQLANLFDVTTDFLLGVPDKINSETTQPKVSTVEIDVINRYRSLTSTSQATISNLLDHLHTLEHQPKEEFVHIVKQNVFDFPYATEESTIELPMPNGKASAGLGNYIFGDDVETIKVIVNDITRKADFLMEVDGWSMSPKFDSGDIVAVRDVPDIALGEIGVFVLNNDRFIKQRGDDGLISLNPDYDDIDVNEYDEVICLGKVIAKIDPEHIVD